jgi:hypothetical protein
MSFSPWTMAVHARAARDHGLTLGSGYMRLDLKVFVLVEILHQDGHHSFSTIPRKKIWIRQSQRNGKEFIVVSYVIQVISTVGSWMDWCCLKFRNGSSMWMTLRLYLSGTASPSWIFRGGQIFNAFDTDFNEHLANVALVQVSWEPQITPYSTNKWVADRILPWSKKGGPYLCYVRGL